MNIVDMKVMSAFNVHITTNVLFGLVNWLTISVVLQPGVHWSSITAAAEGCVAFHRSSFKVLCDGHLLECVETTDWSFWLLVQVLLGVQLRISTRASVVLILSIQSLQTAVWPKEDINVCKWSCWNAGTVTVPSWCYMTENCCCKCVVKVFLILHFYRYKASVWCM